MKKKIVLPFAALALMVGIAGCQGEGGTSTDGGAASTSAPASKMEQIKITAADNVKSILVGGTLKLTADKEGVTWSSKNESIASVDSATGLVTAKALGSVVINAKKEGFKDGAITINVVRPAPTAKIDWKDADHYSVDGSYTRSNRGPGDTPVYSKTQADGGEPTFGKSNSTEPSLIWLAKDTSQMTLPVTTPSRKFPSVMST